MVWEVELGAADALVELFVVLPAEGETPAEQGEEQHA